MEEATLGIEGMTCGSCSQSIERHVGGLKGVETIQVSLLTKMAIIQFNKEQISIETIMEEIKDIGFDCSLRHTKVLKKISTTTTTTTTTQMEQQEKEKEKEKEEKMIEIEIKDTELSRSTPGTQRYQGDISIFGMTCASCSNAIEKHVSSLQGVQSIQVSLISHSGCVIYNNSLISIDTIVEEIKDLGYDVEVLSAAPRSKNKIHSNKPNNETDETIEKRKEKDEEEMRKYGVEMHYSFSFLETKSEELEKKNEKEKNLKDWDNQIQKLLIPVVGKGIVNIEFQVVDSKKRKVVIQLNRRNILPSGIVEILSYLKGIQWTDLTLKPLFPSIQIEEKKEVQEKKVVADEGKLDVGALPKRPETEEKSTVTFLLEELDEDTEPAKMLQEEIMRRWPRFITSVTCNIFTKHLKVEYYRRGGDLCCQDATIRDIYAYLINETQFTEVVVLDSLAKERDEFRAAQWRAVQSIYRKLVISSIFSIPIFILDMILPMTSSYMHDLLLKRPVIPERPYVTLLGLLLLILSIPVQFYVGKFFYKSAWVALKHKRSNMSTLIAVGTSAAWIYAFISMMFAFVTKPDKSSEEEGMNMEKFAMEGGEHFFETATTIITIVWFGKWLQERAKGKTCEALAKMMDLQESNAELVNINECGEIIEDQKENLVSTELITINDIVRVRRGQKMPLDGTVVAGSTSVDEATITGESIPRNVSIGDTVISSSINCGDSVIYVRCDKLKSESVLSQMIDLLKSSQLSKPSQQEFADKISEWFVPAVIAISILTFLFWYLLCIFNVVPENYYKPYSPFLFSLSFALAVVVIACPCALGLATPAAVMVGIGMASKYSLLVKGGDVLEMAYNLTTIVFDKTGTLTLGSPNVIQFVNFQEADDRGMSKEEMVRLAASAELNSEHPLGKAIVNYARTEYKITDLSSPENFISLAGKGIKAQVNGKKVKIGNWQYLFENTDEDEDTKYPRFSNPKEIMEEMQSRALRGHVTLLLAIDNVLCGMICLFDAPRAEAKVVLQQLQQMKISTKILTGDAQITAHAVAKYIGLENVNENVISQVLPQEKHAVIQSLQQGQAWNRNNNVHSEDQDKTAMKKNIQKVGMVGDGVNDAAALAQADLGIAIGHGTDIAIEAAGVILMSDNLEHIMTLLDLSRVIIHRIRWNFLWALGFNALGIPIAAGVFYPAWKVRLAPEFAAIAMACSSLCVLASSLALNWYRSPYEKGGKLNKINMPSKGCQCGLKCNCANNRKKTQEQSKVNALSLESTTKFNKPVDEECMCENCSCGVDSEQVPLVARHVS